MVSRHPPPEGLGRIAAGGEDSPLPVTDRRRTYSRRLTQCFSECPVCIIVERSPPWSEHGKSAEPDHPQSRMTLSLCRAMLGAAAIAGFAACSETTRPNATEPVALRITPPVDFLFVGDSMRLQARLLTSDSIEIEGRTVTWSSSDSTVLRISNTGMLTAVLPTPAVRVRAAAAGITDSLTLEVRLRPITGRAPITASVLEGRSFPLQQRRCLGTENIGSCPPISVIWRSLDPTVLSISGDSVATANAPGLARVIASTSQGVDTATVRVVNAGYTVTYLGALGGGYSVGLDINDAGQVVGNSSTSAGDTVAYIWQAGSMRALGIFRLPSHSSLIDARGRVVGTPELPGPPGGVVTAVSDHGEVAGRWNTGDSAFAVRDGVVSRLGDAGRCGDFRMPVPMGRNDAGGVVGRVSGTTRTCYDPQQVAGAYWPASGPVSLFVSSYTWLPVHPTAVNNAGHYTVWRTCRHCHRRNPNGSSGVDGTLHRETTVQIPGLAVDANVYPLDLNEKAQVVGRAESISSSGQYVFHGFIYHDGATTDLSLVTVDAAWEILVATGINESGQIVGTARNSITGQSGAVLLTPAPG